MHACTYPAGGPTGKENQATTQSVRSEEFVVFQGRPRSRVDQPTLRTPFRWRGFALLRQISHHAIDISLVLMQKETTKWGARTDRCFFLLSGEAVKKELQQIYSGRTLRLVYPLQVILNTIIITATALENHCPYSQLRLGMADDPLSSWHPPQSPPSPNQAKKTTYIGGRISRERKDVEILLFPS